MLLRNDRGRERRSAGLIWVVVLGAVAGACTSSPSKDKVLGGAWPADADVDEEPSGSDDAGVLPPKASVECLPVASPDHLPAREAVMNGQATSSQGAGMTTSDLYGKFVDYCGRCHTNGANQGGFDVSLANFVEKLKAGHAAGGNEDSLVRMRSDDAKIGMPQPFKAFSQRAPGDPVVVFAAELDQWLAAGAPDVFFPSSAGGSGSAGSKSFLLSRKVGLGLTNLGNCVPSTGMFMSAPSQADMLDARFAEMQSFADLPKKLIDTDLSTLDSEQLAKDGVIAFAPGYPLWSDDAKKLRHVRVPRGESIRFDAEKQSFDIPANTRFYKTFMKSVVDLDGNKRYRKIETRLIVSRPERTLADGSTEPAALFATYKWNDAETEATLNDQPYTSDGTGFKDDVFTYVPNERLEDQMLSQAKSEAEMLAAGARRTYAIPGSDRCVHCHMGQSSFVLGFIPLQIHRRPLGEGGVIEPTGEDELNQLQRLIDYGVISGMTSPEELVLLEDSQGSRKPRNEHELAAQGYMLGNCAHCHNPIGFPSKREQVLADALDFMPSEKGGIFQFPLDKFSPRSFRGAAQDIRIPYITPSLFDHPDTLTYPNASPKWIKPGVPDLESESRLASALGSAGIDEIVAAGGRPLLAPWRSLIYRNVDAPASYEDSGAIYPHMPMDTSGYDCRVRQLMGTWMASIPASRVSKAYAPTALADYGEAADREEQPYMEVLPDDPSYRGALAAAKVRLARFQDSERYRDCPSPDLDIVAPEVASGRTVIPDFQSTRVQPELGDKSDHYILSSPARPHYAKTDLRDDPIWIQRRPDWFQILVVDAANPQRDKQGGQIAKDSQQAIKAVNSLKITDAAKAFALERIPFGLWQVKPECKAKLESQPKVGDFNGAARPAWLTTVNGDDPRKQLDPATPVYMVSRGEQIFNTVCSKCHGPLANGVSALANTIGDLTGGKTRVANLRDGLFGPMHMPGQNRGPVFASAADKGDKTCKDEPTAARCVGLTAEDWVARYVVWMGLGGTNAAIPSAVLVQIGSAKVLGAKRYSNFAAAGTVSDAANMLGVAKKACQRLLPSKMKTFDFRAGRVQGPFSARDKPDLATIEGDGLIAINGDLELWRDVCEFQNPGFVRAIAGTVVPTNSEKKDMTALFPRSLFPVSARVGAPGGTTAERLQPDNAAPWCVYSGQTDPAHARCPEPLVTPDGLLDWEKVASQDERDQWAAQGAANAGLAVYLYLDALSRGEVKPTPTYDHCEQL